MITISPKAVERIRQSAAESGVEPPVLRVAAKIAGDGTLDYGMGFDQSRSGDASVEVDGIQVVVAEASRELVSGTHLDFVEVEPGDFRFIFVQAGETPEP